VLRLRRLRPSAAVTYDISFSATSFAAEGAGLIDSSEPNDNFSLNIIKFTGAPVIESFLYMRKSSGTAQFDASRTSVRRRSCRALDLAMMLVRLAGLGWLTRLRRRKAYAGLTMRA
jgi:hypothetical protein